MGKEQITVIIPAYQPDEKLTVTVENLVQSGFQHILVIDDGSDVSCKGIFEKIEKMPECTLLVHEQNKGKGAALKTSFRYIIDQNKETSCVVTADADGQHLVKDIEAVAMKALQDDKIVLGVRNFSNPDVPARSAFGNKVTSGVFRLFFGMKISDTQTGLRAFPKKYLADLLEADGDRYEYETNMLFMMNRRNIPFGEVEITTVYLEDNQSSHFRVVRDSIRIYALILKYLFSSVSSALIDEGLFFVLKKCIFLTNPIIPLTFIAAFLARVVSSLYNYWVNAKHVFKGEVGGKSLCRYYILAVAQIALSALLVFAVERLGQITSAFLSTLIKTVIDTILFFFSFRIQHKWVFNGNKTNGESTNS